MREKKIGIGKSTGGLANFLCDGELLNGLYYVNDKAKALKNLREFNIEMRKLNNDKVLGHDYFLREDICILIIYHENGEQIQYSICKDLDLMELITTPDSDIPSDLKSYIINGKQLLDKSKVQ